MEKVKTQWHPAFCSAMELILERDMEHLEFMREYNLSRKPLEVDLLVIKKPAGYEVTDPIGRIFREHNLFEYKSPDDEVNIDTFYKVNAYAALYKASSGTVDGIKAGNVTISLIREAKPGKLFKNLVKEGFLVSNPYKGIYYVGGKSYFSTQVIVSRELSGEQYVWLQALTRALDEQTAKKLVLCARDYSTQGEKELISSVLTVSTQANDGLFAKMKEDSDMYEALQGLFADEINQRIANADMNARQEEKQSGLRDLVIILKGMLPDFDAVYQKIVQCDSYADVSREQVMKYWK